ncbi:MAG: hypothetical protein AB8B55_02690 [Mariniblastus sp.]
MRQIVLGFLVLASVVAFPPGSSSRHLNAQEIGFLEDFVLAQDREKVLKQLVPGTESYYYFHALHYQNNQQLDKVDELLKTWVKRAGKTDRFRQIENRQQLLKYSDDPKATLEYLTRQLGLNFNHQREIPQTQRDLASKLDPKSISTSQLLESALSGRDTNRLTDQGLRLLAGKKLSKTQRRHLLGRLSHPDFPELVDLIVADLNERDSKSFGGIKIHNLLTLKQLTDLAAKYPKAKSNTIYINTYLSKLQPSEDTNWETDPGERRAYLDRMWNFVEPLDSKFNSLKACVLFRQLELDLAEQKHNRDRFMAYLKLPRSASYINPTLVKNTRNRGHIVNLNANYSNWIRLMPIRNDEPLIREYLHHFLLDADDESDFQPYILDKYLERQFATVKILNGIGDSEKWASKLTPEEYKQLLDRIDVEFASTNPEFFSVNDDVELELHIKNAKNLIVRVFEINTQNYYRKHKREIDTDINLDGLVPNFEQNFSYDTPPAIRKSRKFKFPQIKNRGVYVVDLIAGGKSSRALIRKGRLQISNQVISAGQLFTVIDQSGAVVEDANLWIDGARYYPQKDGKVLIPFSTKPGRTNAIISQGDFNCLQTFNHVAENYAFKAAMVIDRENLTRSNKAKVLIRASLQIAGGNPVPVETLKNSKLVITTVNLDGISTTKTIDDVNFSNTAETICEFIVPPRLKTVSLKLTSEVKNLSKNKIENVVATQTYAVNAIDKSDSIQDIHLVPSSRGYFLELLGKSGEIRVKQAVRLTIKHQDFTITKNVDLQTDEKGLIELGDLENVQYITATPVAGTKKTWQIHTQDQTYYSTVHAKKGKSIELPAPAGVTTKSRDNISLFEIRRGKYIADQYESVDVKDGLVIIDDLQPGDYELRLTYNAQTSSTYFQKIKIRVTDAEQANNVLVGANRHLETRGSKALHVARMTTGGSKIRIQLENADASTRVHVIANRYQPAYNAFGQFSKIRDVEPWVRRPSLRRSVYMEGRKIGDEYEYILRRKYASKFPGNMLERPSLLLNPWEVQSTSNGSQDAAGGNDYGVAGNAADKSGERGKSNKGRASGNNDFANLDYLDDGAVLLANLKPNKNGIVTIDRDKLGVSQHIRVVALNSFHTIQRTVDLPLLKLQPRDSRLAHALESDKHFSQSKQIQILKKGESLLIEDIISAKFQQYDDLGDVFLLFQTLNSGTHLSKFKFILTWSDKTQKEKQELYSKYACHELNFFLMKKDSKFFSSIVVPHLRNKRDKTFMDLWLLRENLEEFASPRKYARLNVVERILLAQRLEERTADIVRNVNETYRVTPTTRAQFDGLYDTTIRGLGLANQEWEKRELITPKKNLPRLSALPAPMAPGGGGMEQQQAQIAGGLGGGGGGLGGARLNESKAGPSQYYRRPEILGRSATPQVMFVEDEMDLKADLAELESINGSIGGRRNLALLRKSKSNPRSSDFFAGGKIAIDGKKTDSSRYRFETRTRTVPVQKTRTETRTKQVPVTKTRVETRTRTLANGKTESYQVTVPYTEMVTQNYSVSVPYTENVTQNYTVRIPINENGQDGLEVRNELQLGFYEQTKSLYRRLSPTKEWMENNYYLLRPDQQSTDLVRVNRFWRDYANHDGGDFLSPYFSESHRTFTEMMFALSVLDLPLEGPEQKFDYVENSMKVTAGGPTIALHQQVRDAILERGNTTVLASENFFQKNDRYKFEDGVRFDKFVSDDFLAHTLYGAQVVITNPTSTPRAVELLIQIPLGSVACSGSQETRTIQLDLAAFSTKTFEYSFYFPTAGNFDHYPAHVSAEEKVLAVAENTTFKVIDRPAKVDKDSWEFVSQNGTQEEVLDYLNQKNILRINLDKIAFRMKDKKFFAQTIERLRNRYVYNHTLWSYSIEHNDVKSIREYLTHSQQILSNVGQYFRSELLEVDPVEQNWYQHKEYWPLVNARAHQLGPQRKILNPNFFRQYNDLLTVLANRRELTDDDHLVVTYYMLLQDRIETALEHFDSISNGELPSKIQYDYCDAYLDMYREKPDDAASKAKKWETYPVDHWRNRFKNIIAQVTEIKGGTPETVDEKDNSQIQTELASKSESFDFEIESGIAKIKHQNLKEVKVNFYEMDIELLFSRSPFAQDELDGFSMIRPNLTQVEKFKKAESATNGKGKHEFKLPTSMQNKNILIEVVAGDQTKSQPYFAHSLDVQLMEKFGQVQVTEEDSNKAISKTYVKVYARMLDGSVRFHKDGYTDLRGRFDYVSQSNRSIDGIEKFSILVLSDENGAVIKQADPPKE